MNFNCRNDYELLIELYNELIFFSYFFLDFLLKWEKYVLKFFLK